MVKRGHMRKAIALLLVTLFFLGGCSFTAELVESPPETVEPTTIITQPSDVPVTSLPEPGQFTLRYVPDSSINPILNRDNIVLSSLLYESLFTLDGALNVKPVLCESWSTEDYITYTFIIKPDIAMSDGGTLSADDVVYTLRQAMQSGLFVNRLSGVMRVESEEDLTVTVVLESANSRFTHLLDIPIIRNGSIDDFAPPGSGPYVFTGARGMRLERFPRHRDFESLPLPSIQLVVCDDNEVAELFDSGVLSLLVDDPSGTSKIILNRHNEVRFYNTTTLQYIGYNTRSIVLMDEDVRRAIGSSLDRQYITDDIMPGQSLAAQLALSPVYRLYDSQWEQMVIDPLIEMSALLRRAGLHDDDNDSFLEYPDGFGGYYKFALDFIVNSDNAYKVQAAHRIADTLRLYGFEIIVRELPWLDFLDALDEGAFDMYYGETTLSADFDLSPLLLPNGHLNYGLTGSYEFEPLIGAFLSAQTDEDERMAAERLCDEISVKAPFVPILYKRYAVYTPIGAITGAAPSQSGVFDNFTEWTIDLTMLK